MAAGAPFEGDASQGHKAARRRVGGALGGVAAEVRLTALHETESSLLDAVIEGRSDPALDSVSLSRAGTASTAPVRRAVDMIMAQSREPLTLGDVAAAAGVGGRALQIAFRRHLGCSPLTFLRLVRLADARRLLGLGLVSRVTDAAMQAGFWHLGEFAVAYRQRYGEKPSTTLKECPYSQFR